MENSKKNTGVYNSTIGVVVKNVETYLPTQSMYSEYNEIFMAFAKNAINVNGKLVSPYKH